MANLFMIGGFVMHLVHYRRPKSCFKFVLAFVISSVVILLFGLIENRSIKFRYSRCSYFKYEEHKFIGFYVCITDI